MTNFKLPDGAVSERSLVVRYGFNQKHVRTLLGMGVLRSLGPGILADSLADLLEGEHYIVCLGCGAKQAAITSKHLRKCSRLDVAGYVDRYPDAPLASAVTDKARAKSKNQRLHQSETLKRRFQTDAGATTRQQIAESSKRLMQTPYRERAGQHLRRYVRDHREELVEKAKKRWQDPEFRARMSQIPKDREKRLGSANYARGFITKTFSKIHRSFEEALVREGVEGLIREFSVGPYRVDEALPEIKVAIEVDGCYWHGCRVCGLPGQPDTLKLDRRRTTYLSKRGWRIIRVPGHRVEKELQKVAREVVEALHVGRTSP